MQNCLNLVAKCRSLEHIHINESCINLSDSSWIDFNHLDEERKEKLALVFSNLTSLVISGYPNLSISSPTSVLRGLKFARLRKLTCHNMANLFSGSFPQIDSLSLVMDSDFTSNHLAKIKSFLSIFSDASHLLLRVFSSRLAETVIRGRLDDGVADLICSDWKRLSRLELFLKLSVAQIEYLVRALAPNLVSLVIARVIGDQIGQGVVDCLMLAAKLQQVYFKSVFGTFQVNLHRNFLGNAEI